jgi:hypothetical protein
MTASEIDLARLVEMAEARQRTGQAPVSATEVSREFDELAVRLALLGLQLPAFVEQVREQALEIAKAIRCSDSIALGRSGDCPQCGAGCRRSS